jgi:hypothetical protein
MNTILCDTFTKASLSEREHTTIVLNHTGSPAKPGDLLVPGDVYDECKKNLLEKVNADDLHRVFVISNSRKTTGMVTLACKGNGEELGLPTAQKPVVKVEDLSLTDPKGDYLFNDFCAKDMLNAAQLLQASELAVDQSCLWFFLHLGRNTAHKAHQIQCFGRELLPKLKSFNPEIDWNEEGKCRP